MLHTKEPYPPLTRSPFPCGEGLYVGGFTAFFYWVMSESGFLVTSYSYDTREGIVSHA